MLNNKTFYNHHIRDAIIAFGRCFSGVQLVRVNPNDAAKNQTLDIPLTYAPKEKAIVRIEQDPELNNHVHTVLPCMSFEIVGFSYDGSRKLNRMSRVVNKNTITNNIITCVTTSGSTTLTSNGLFGNVLVDTHVEGIGIPAGAKVLSKASSSSLTLTAAATASGSSPRTFYVPKVNETFTPVPYNVSVSLYILTKSQEDNLQILEQILPAFTPEYTVSINAMPDLNLSNDLPIVLESVSMEDEYDGNFENRRFVTTTLTFTLKLNLFGGVKSTNAILRAIEKFSAVANLNDTLGSHETLTSVGTKPGQPIVDTWTSNF